MPKPVVMEDFAPVGDGSLGMGYLNMYRDILEGYTVGYGRAFEGIRDWEEGEALLFHCTGRHSKSLIPFFLSLLIVKATDLVSQPVRTVQESWRA